MDGALLFAARGVQVRPRDRVYLDHVQVDALLVDLPMVLLLDAVQLHRGVRSAIGKPDPHGFHVLLGQVNADVLGHRVGRVVTPENFADG